MAETIGFAIIAAVTSSATASVVGAYAVAGVTLSTIVGSTAILGVSVGANLLLAEINQPPKRNETQQSVLNQAIGARIGVYGRTILGGTRMLFADKNGALLQAIIIAAHELDAIEKFLIGDRYAQVLLINTAGDGTYQVKDFPQIDVVSYEVHLGSADQLASPYLLTQFGGGPGAIWTADHRARGLAYVAVQFIGVKPEERSVVYPQSYATALRFLVRGKKVWDPTNPAHDPDDKSTFAFSEIASDCILDYLLSQDGARFRRSKIDVASFQDAHNLHAETVTRKDGSTEYRYRISGTYRYDEAPKDVLARMLATCDGRLVRGPTGLIGIRGGRHTPHAVTIGTRSITRASLTPGHDRLDTYNRLKLSYSDPDAYYQPTELQARQDTASQAQIGIVDKTDDLVMVPSWTQAARLGKIMYSRDHPAWMGTISTDLSALAAMGEDTVRISFDPLGDADVEPMMDVEAELPAIGLRGDMSGCDLQFSAISAEAYAWDPATEEPPRPALPTYVPPTNDVIAPTGVNVSQSLRGGQAWAILAWSAATRPDAVPQPQYRNSIGDDGDYVGMTLRGDGQSAEVGPLVDGQTYRFRIRFTAGGTPSPWSNTVSLLVDTTP